MKNILLLMVFVASSIAVQAQSATLQTFEENAQGYNLYLYQSVLRLLNNDQNPDFNKLVKDLDHIKFVSSAKGPDPEAFAKYELLKKGVEKEGFETILEFDRKDGHARIYEQSSRKEKSTWLMTFVVDDRVGFMEMKGALNLKYISALESLNFEKLEDLAKGN